MYNPWAEVFGQISFKQIYLSLLYLTLPGFLLHGVANYFVTDLTSESKSTFIRKLLAYSKNEFTP